MSTPLKLPPIPVLPDIPSIPKVPKIVAPAIGPALPSLAALITKALKGSKLQLPSLKPPGGAVANIIARLDSEKEAIQKSIEKQTLPYNTVARLKEQAESFKSKYSFDTPSAIASAGLEDKLGAAKTDLTKRITKPIVGN